MSSAKRRTTTKSGGSGTSPKTAISRKTGNSSPTVPASFGEVFGEGNPEVSKQIADLQRTLNAYQAQVEDLMKVPLPTVALFRQRHLQRLWKARRMVRDCGEAIRHLKGELPAKTPQ